MTNLFRISFFIGVILLLLQETHRIVVPNYILIVPFVIAIVSLIIPVFMGMIALIAVTFIGKNKQKKDKNDKDE